MVDTLLKHREKFMQSLALKILGFLENLVSSLGRFSTSRGKNVEQPVRSYVVLTLYRPRNVDQSKTLKSILNALTGICENLPIIFPVHPRTRARLAEFGLQRYFKNSLVGNQGDVGQAWLYCVDQLSYLDFLCLSAHTSLVLTDSGGILEETTILGVPCVTIRENTEQPITVTRGTNVIAGIKTQSIILHVQQRLEDLKKQLKPNLWDGRASCRIVENIDR